MSRVQLSSNVSELDAAVAFYSRLFGAEQAKLRPGYANFAIDDPPLKLALNSPGNGGWPDTCRGGLAGLAEPGAVGRGSVIALVVVAAVPGLFAWRSVNKSLPPA